MEWLTKDLRELYERAKGYQQNQAPSPDYSTGRTDGFYEGVRYVFEKIAEQSNEPLTLEELREMGGEPYWHIGLRDDSPPPHWAILPSYVAQRPQDFFYGKHWLAYRRRQEEEYC